MGWILTYIHEGIIPYVLIINVVRHVVTLKRVIWVLCLTGSLLGALSLYQELTQSGFLSAEPRKHLMVTDTLSKPTSRSTCRTGSPSRQLASGPRSCSRRVTRRRRWDIE